MLLPGIAGSLAAVTISDQFVPNIKFELRFWLLTVLMLMLSLAVKSLTREAGTKTSGSVSTARGD